MTMEIIHKRTRELRGYDHNARTHSDQQVGQIASSITEFGFNNPVLIDETSTVIAGHGRLAAAHRLGLDTVPCIVLGHLSDAQRRAYILADNKIALNAGWDKKLLALELGELGDLIDLNLLGFSEKEVLELLPLTGADGKTDPDDVPDLPAQAVTMPGDVWTLGNHRLMCGDSTSAAHWSTLTGGGAVVVGVDRSALQRQLWRQGVRPERGAKRSPQYRPNFER